MAGIGGTDSATDGTGDQIVRFTTIHKDVAGLVIGSSGRTVDMICDMTGCFDFSLQRVYEIVDGAKYERQDWQKVCIKGPDFYAVRKAVWLVQGIADGHIYYYDLMNFKHNVAKMVPPVG